MNHNKTDMGIHSVQAIALQPREIALDVGQEHRDADPGKPFGQDLQRYGLAGAGGAGNQPMAVAECGEQVLQVLTLANKDWINFTHEWVFPMPGGSVKLPLLIFLLNRNTL